MTGSVVLTMPFQVDTATMFLALVASTAAATLVLLWTYWLNRVEKAALWLAGGFFIGAIATLLLAGRAMLPEGLAIKGGGALLLVGVSCIPVAARVFNRKSAAAWMLMVAPGIWLALASVPAIYDNFDARVTVLCVLTAIPYLLGAREYWVRDGLMTRLPIAVTLTVHGVLVLARIPFILVDGAAGVALSGDGWFGVSTLEAVIFIQVSAFLMILLSKERVEGHLREMAHTDQLTQLGNRRAFFVRAEAAVAQSVRNHNPLSAIVFDLDRFKDINDRFGHPIGDAVLRAFASAATRRLRASDFVARIGGEEFAALLPDTDSGHAALVALQINQAFEKAVGELGLPGLTGSSSAGVADLSVGAQSLEELLIAADRALYEAKSTGRGQVRRTEGKKPEAVRAA